MQLSAEQKQKIAEMECKLLSKSLDKEYPPVMLPDVGVNWFFVICFLMFVVSERRKITSC